MQADPSITKLRMPKRFSVGGADPVKNWDTRALEFAPTDTLMNTGVKTLRKTPWDSRVEPPERKTSLKQIFLRRLSHAATRKLSSNRFV